MLFTNLFLTALSGEQEALKGTISLGVRRREKTGKHGKLGVKRKWWVFQFPARKLKAVTQGGIIKPGG